MEELTRHYKLVLKYQIQENTTFIQFDNIDLPINN